MMSGEMEQLREQLVAAVFDAMPRQTTAGGSSIAHSSNDKARLVNEVIDSLHLTDYERIELSKEAPAVVNTMADIMRDTPNITRDAAVEKFNQIKGRS
jgi:hypothetical protein